MTEYRTGSYLFELASAGIERMTDEGWQVLVSQIIASVDGQVRIYVLYQRKPHYTSRAE